MNQFLTVPYLDEGRTLAGADCWGLSMLAREAMGLPDIPLAGGTSRDTVHAMQQEFRRVSSALARDVVQPGALAAVFQGDAFVHVGVVVEADGRLWVLETNPGVGPCMRRIADFNAAYYKVVYYADRDIPESPRSTPD